MRLETRELATGYGDFQALFGIDLAFEEGETTAIIGANGAGKSTLMKAVTGLVPTEPDMIVVDGTPVGGRPAEAVIDAGIALVPEGRRLFPSLTVEENLLMGRRAGRAGRWTLEAVYEAFPVLAERRHLSSSALSGGQQQMVSIGRALMSNPDLLLCDEISLGLAPVVIEELYHTIATLKRSGMTIVIVEQDIARAMAVSDRVHCMQEGRVSLSGDPKTLSRDEITQAYFGVA